MYHDYQNYNIIVCGTGATGSHLISFLTQMLAYKERVSLLLIDGDIVETKNLRNQKFLPLDEGQPKAKVLQHRYKSIYPKLNVRYVDKYVETKDDLINYLSHYDTTLNILVGCVDNNPTRKVLSSAFLDASANILYIDSGNGTLSMDGQIVVGYKTRNLSIPYQRKNYYGNYAPCVAELYEEINADLDTVNQATSCGYSTDKNPQNIATNVMAANCLFAIINQAVNFNSFLTGIHFFNAATNQVQYRAITEPIEPLHFDLAFEASLKEIPNIPVCIGPFRLHFEIVDHDILYFNGQPFDNNDCSFYFDTGTISELTKGNPCNTHVKGSANSIYMICASDVCIVSADLLTPYLNDFRFTEVSFCLSDEELLPDAVRVTDLSCNYAGEKVLFEKHMLRYHCHYQNKEVTINTMEVDIC